jgi:hypothetical protein
MPGDIGGIVFVNGGSEDCTAEVARRLRPGGIRVRQTRTGKGRERAKVMCSTLVAVALYRSLSVLYVVDVDDAVLNRAGD